MRLAPLALAAALAADDPSRSFEGAKWIWSAGSEPGDRPADEVCALRRKLVLPAPPVRAVAWIACDNHFELAVNGLSCGRGDDWNRPAKIDLTQRLVAGENRLEATCRNDSGPAGLVAALDLSFADGTTLRVVTDSSWESASPAAPDERKPARELADFGAPPWGRLETIRDAPRFDPLQGFRVVTVAAGFGSVDTFTRSASGSLLASVEGDGIVELCDGDGDGACEVIEAFSDAIHGCQGLLWHEGALLATGTGPSGLGLYRVPRTNAPSPAAIPELLLRFGGDNNEHGPHAIVLGQDGWLYVMVGNHASLADARSADSPYRLTYEGHLLPRYLDPRGHAVDCKAPGGFVARVHPRTRECQLFAAGFRNAYDHAFDEQGRLFTLDSDMEWDIDVPWYRPVRLIHVVAGGEYGWRTGSICWPDDYEDSLPAALDVGRGSPTGMCLCTSRRFPARFRGALLAGDWSQGKILAFRIEPRGATVAATSETLLGGHPLNVTDLEMDDDGSLLFSVGGRGTAGGVHRLVYDGPREVSARSGPSPQPVVTLDASADLATLLAALGDEDRFVRFAAARELERRDPQTWEAAAVKLERPLARGQALIALARLGFARADRELLPARFDAAVALLASGATGAARLAALRALELLLLDPELGPARQPGPTSTDGSASQFDGAPLLALFPCGDRGADRELAQLVAYLAPPTAAERLWHAFEQEPSREQQIVYAYALRCLGGEWPQGARLELCRWLDRAIAAGGGGMSFEGYLRHLRQDVVAGLAADERTALDAETAAAQALPSAPPAAAAEPRDLDRTLAFVERTLRAPRRSPQDGALVYQELCARCHRRFELGQNVGPDLTTAGARFNLHDLLETIVAPSRVVSDQYRGVNVFLKNGDVESGLPLVDDGTALVLMTTSGQKLELKAADVASRRPSAKSTMPDGLLDGLTLEQIADLCAYLLADLPIAPAAAPTWRALFDGHTLTGLEGDPTLWSVADGVIVGRAEGRPVPSHLIVAEPFADFTIEFDLELGAPDHDSGLCFRGRRVAPDRLAGSEADAGNRHWGWLSDAGGRGLLAPVKEEIWWPLAAAAGWNHFVVAARGPHVTIELNGGVTVDLDDPEGAQEGLLGFELDGKCDLRIRNVRVRRER